MRPLPILNNPDSFKNLKICVLQPDYSTSGVDYQNYDPQRDLSAILPEAKIDHVFLNKLTTYQQLKQLKENKYDIYINLCEGSTLCDYPLLRESIGKDGNNRNRC